MPTAKKRTNTANTLTAKPVIPFQTAKQNCLNRTGGRPAGFPLVKGKTYKFAFDEITTETISTTGQTWERVPVVGGGSVSLSAFLRAGAVQDINGNELDPMGSDFDNYFQGKVELKVTEKDRENDRNYYHFQLVQ